MHFNKHSDYEGKHALLSASKYHWIRYSEDKLVEFYHQQRAAERGTKLHDLARQCIELGVKLPRNRKTLNMYVNDCIGFGMTPEVILFYSPRCFGTADAISFNNKLLRISDLKTGVHAASMDQLLIYASLFCLEYRLKPEAFVTELRIYQLDEIALLQPEPNQIGEVMNRIVVFDNELSNIQREEGIFDGI